jgi:CMP-N-acetylneuraminic acid synthetase
MEQTDTRKSELEVLAFIPARGGSKGLPRKNILALCGKPLIAYSIEAALAAKNISRVVVSTDDPEIAEISQAYGAEVPFLRPESMATDHASIGLAYEHMLQKFEEQGYIPDATVTLYPTSPFRTPALLDYLCGQFAAGYNFVNTVRRLELDKHPMLYRKNGLLHPLLSTKAQGKAGHMPFERRYGFFQGTRYRAEDKYFLHFINDEASLVDIDTLEDFLLAEEIIKSGTFRFEG